MVNKLIGLEETMEATKITEDRTHVVLQPKKTSKVKSVTPVANPKTTEPNPNRAITLPEKVLPTRWKYVTHAKFKV